MKRIAKTVVAVPIRKRRSKKVEGQDLKEQILAEKLFPQ